MYSDYGYGLLLSFVIMYIIGLAYSVLLIISLWKLLKKFGKPGWICLIPFYNTWVLFETQGIQGWWSLVPFANIIFMYIAYYKMAINLGKDSGFAVLTIFFPGICLPILAFSKNTVVKNTTQNQSFDYNNNGQYQTYSSLYDNNPIINNYNEQNSNNMNGYNQNNINPNVNMNGYNQSNINPDNISNQTNIPGTCPGCGYNNPQNSAFCSNCGRKL